jgi:phage tail P2-like protein
MSERIHSPLLPPNQTRLEASLANAATLVSVPEVIATLWDAQRCPVALLPWLAWALSVDEWDENWSEAQQRATVMGSIALHRKKGTPWAVKQALTRAGLERVALVERIEGAHWAEFDVDITVVDRPLVESIYSRIEALVNAYKPARSHLRRLIVSVASRGSAYFACASMAGDTVTVHPYQLTELIAPPMQPTAGIGGHDWGTTTIFPRAA